ncbi:FAD-binding oxidoreductase [Actinoplanes palleronii]|uniref:Oxidoreductase n=1 Tax=Actinoplanes palleronii TaxID=113570 RepID=A0ABQ4B188_9ACTN|nr:FAD-binding oxidoreductase [Actinoplanes palleronii]GIE64432.1 oxidoreductase [Actinoplanes palleronii]
MSLIRRGDDGYEAARTGRIFNDRHPERYPAAILRPADADQVAAGVRRARAENLTVSVRSGGHSWAAWSLRDDALLIDLERLNRLDYDPATGVVIAGPAVRGGLDLAPFLAERGRAFPGGHCPEVGLGGYLLQGGQGWNGRRMGWACESVVAVDVVTADGEQVHADSEQHSDLYWAARGAGPGFPGIVTAFHLRTYEAPAVMWHDTRTFHPDDAAVLLGWLHDLLPGLDRRIEPVLAATRLPGETTLLLHTTVMAGSDDEAAALLRVFGDGPLAGKERSRVTGPTSIAQECVAQAEQSPEGYRYAVDCTWTDAPADVLEPLLSRLWRELDTEHSFAIWYGWAPDHELPDMAFSVQGNVYIATYAIYADPADDEKYRTWVHERTADLARHGTGVYLGDTDFTGRQDRFLSGEHYRRLEEIRAHRDPAGVFASYLTADRERLNVHD